MAESLLVSWALLWIAGILLFVAICYAIAVNKRKNARIKKLEEEKAQLNKQ